MSEEDAMPTCVLYLLGYSAVLAAECLEAINVVSEEVIWFDLSVVRIPSRGRRLRRNSRRSWSRWSTRGSAFMKTSMRRSRSWRSRDVETSGPSLV